MDDEDTLERGYSVRGRVQGVGFRWWTRQTAADLGLSGAVKNLRDGSVEVRVRGPASAVKEFRERLDRGPSSARVEEVRESDTSLPLEDGTFRIVH